LAYLAGSRGHASVDSNKDAAEFKVIMDGAAEIQQLCWTLVEKVGADHDNEPFT
jgi:hypothetical protein